eukprot:CAMPEP_0201877290 /NCGR_PEP_ID=MMETSP0902-20130614/8745_1 /ASSEMBLY_ACC=CAM_ASM_000551 /TAXON_ID=420261 /ORGANISM="Thalassiosira antarctica, Strain CCMP982" /LENGTH=383 /DNA_ID=CAMNT_0048404717 /DNA_START=500 /DNA_END=1651 /DNA_ORIENTATION=-
MYPATSPIKLSRVQRNDPTLTELDLAYIGGFTPEKVGDYLINDSTDLTMFGEAIGTNTNLRRLIISTMCVAQEFADMAANNGAFFEGFKRSTSIRELCLERCDFSGGMGRDILNGFVANNCHVRRIQLMCCTLGNGWAGILASAVSGCTNVNNIMLSSCNVDDDILVEFVSGIRGLDQLDLLVLSHNNFGRAGCEALATLLKDPTCNLTCLTLIDNNRVDDNCATILANSLKGNNKLKSLHLYRNGAITENGPEAFSQVLCNTPSVNDTFLSNHTLQNLGGVNLPTNVTSLLELNISGIDEEQVAIEKILRHHTHLDMEPFVEWDLKVLPLAISWFDRARDYAQNNESNIDARKLSAIYQFAKAKPLMIVPPQRKATNKRKMS